MILRIAHNRDSPAICEHGLPLGHGRFGVVGSLAMNIGLDRLEQRCNRGLVENDNVVDVPKRRDHLCTIGLVHNRSTTTLQPSNRLIVIDRDDQSVGLPRGILQVADMPDVEQIEATVCERVRQPLRSIARYALDQRIARQYDTHVGVAILPSYVLARLDTIASLSSAVDTVAVPRFITTSPPA